MAERASPEAALAETRAWVEGIVIGLDLCPFAGEPWREGRVRLRVSDAETPERLAVHLEEELARLDREPVTAIETTLLIHPYVLVEFDAYNQFLDVADHLLEELGLVGKIQIASFHPDYRFAGAPVDDPANATNRSPHPMLHLLREESVAVATRSHPDPKGIPARNAEKLRRRARRPG